MKLNHIIASTLILLFEANAIAAYTPNQVGQQTMSASSPVVVASDQSAIPTTDTNGSSMLTSLQLLDDVVSTIAAAFPTKAYSMAGTDGTNARGIKTDSSGELQVDVLSAVITSGTISTITNPVAVTQSGTWDEVGINDSGNSITVDNGGTFAVQAAQSGTWTVQPGNTANTTPWLTSIHDGTTKASVLDLTNNNPLTTAIVDSNGDQISSFGGGTQYTEGDTDASITGTAMLWEDGSDVLRAVSAAKPLPIDITDTTVAVTQSGTWDEVGINDSGNSITVDNGGTFATQIDGAALTSLQLIDDAVATTASAITTKGVAASGTDGTNARVLKTDTSGELQVDVLSMPTTTITDGSGAMNVIVDSGAITETNSGGIQTAVQLIDDTIKVDDAAFTPATTSVNMAGFEYDDTTPDSVNEGDAGAARMSANRNIYTTLRDAAGNERGANVNASNQLSVSVDNTVTVASHAVTNAGTFAVQSAGDVAHDSVDSGNPVKIGGEARTSEATAVASGDRVEFIADTVGKQVVLPYAIPENFTSGATSAITGTTSTSVIAAPGASVRLYITSVQITNSHASTGTLVSLTDGSGGSTLFECYAGVAGSGCATPLPVPLRLTANTALHAVCGTTGANVYVSAQGYKAP